MGNSFVWSDNWWVENEDAWFVDGENNLLFHYNFLSNKYNLVAEIPYESKNTFRFYPGFFWRTVLSPNPSGQS